MTQALYCKPLCIFMIVVDRGLILHLCPFLFPSFPFLFFPSLPFPSLLFPSLFHPLPHRKFWTFSRCHSGLSLWNLHSGQRSRTILKVPRWCLGDTGLVTEQGEVTFQQRYEERWQQFRNMFWKGPGGGRVIQRFWGLVTRHHPGVRRREMSPEQSG